MSGRSILFERDHYIEIHMFDMVPDTRTYLVFYVNLDLSYSCDRHICKDCV